MHRHSMTDVQTHILCNNMDSSVRIKVLSFMSLIHSFSCLWETAHLLMNSLSISDDPLDTYLWESVLEVGLERTLKNSSPSPYKIYLGELFFTRLHFSKHKWQGLCMHPLNGPVYSDCLKLKSSVDLTTYLFADCIGDLGIWWQPDWCQCFGWRHSSWWGGPQHCHGGQRGTCKPLDWDGIWQKEGIHATH